MKTICALAMAALVGESAAKHHHRHTSQLKNQFIQVNLQDNQAMLAEIQPKIDQIQSLLEVTKMEPSCDEACQKKCDAKADSMIRELKNPLHDITWNCKNNYDVYTSDYDPEHSHFDRISMDVMATQRTINQI